MKYDEINKTAEILQKALQPYHDMQEQMLSELSKSTSVFKEILDNYNEQYRKAYSELTSVQEILNFVQSSISSNIPKLEEMLPSINAMSSLLKNADQDNIDTYIPEDLSNGVYDILDDIQQQAPNTDVNNEVKQKRKKLTRQEAINIIGAIIIPLMMFIHSIYNESNSKPTIENHYDIDINIVNKDTVKLNELIEEISKLSE